MLGAVMTLERDWGKDYTTIGTDRDYHEGHQAQRGVIQVERSMLFSTMIGPRPGIGSQQVL